MILEYNINVSGKFVDAIYKPELVCSKCMVYVLTVEVHI